MMVRRVFLIWIGLVGAWAVLVFGHSRRQLWLASVSDSSLVGSDWSFPWGLFLWGVFGFAVVLLVALMAMTISIINQKRVRKHLHDDDSTVILGVRNFHRSLASGGPLEKVRGLGHFSTVLIAGERGIELMGGVLRLKGRWRLTWAEVEEIDLFTLTAQSHHVSGVGVSMRVKNFAMPLEFALVTSRFPWADVASESEVTSAIDQLRDLRNATVR